jgi:hypothetical protein
MFTKGSETKQCKQPAQAAGKFTRFGPVMGKGRKDRYAILSPSFWRCCNRLTRNGNISGPGGPLRDLNGMAF